MNTQQRQPATSTALMSRETANEMTLTQGGGILPTNVAQAMALADMLASSTFVPTAFRNQPGDVLAAILFGADLGLPPMQALQTIAVVNGKPSVYGDGFLAVLYSSPHFADHEEYYLVKGERVDYVTPQDLTDDQTAAVCSFTRRGRTKPVMRVFTVGDAKKASLWGKQGPWQQYPGRMLMYRARGFAGRDAFPDTIRGVITAEEAVDIIDVTPTEAASAPMPQRASAQPKVENIEGGRKRSRRAETAAAATETNQPAGETNQPATDTPQPAAAPINGELPAAADVIVEVVDRMTKEKLDTQTGEVVTPARPFVEIKTKRGVHGWSPLVDLAKQFRKSGAPVDITADPPKEGQPMGKITAIAPFDPFGGAGK
jgi:hypothetical protein